MQEFIKTVAQVIPVKGGNKGKTMFVINNKYWSNQEPKREHTHVELEEVEIEKDVDGKMKKVPVINVIGYSEDSRMAFADKVQLLNDNANVATAIAMLLK